ncbi:Uncharacterized conserved protein YecE, DUF72 family [Limimonas halophila]|uniref:Uncharacterized conserved protein YecE, DUF72 family n=1 Tax=Limimonas halophila TaxID=1082479 RepID=A0A1G7UWB5_9PROT|nr:DUF72 domain-containing protein [Limimonas halophila]SDG51439.1 Uncharacterized conserved protein YecE, DUF72 family [Limimonas halophila]
MTAAGRVRIGTSGWSYRHWIGPFYPEGTASGEMLARYARTFDTTELNNTFYNLPDADSFAAWREGVPAGFTFAVKANRYITHMKKLKDPDQSTGTFFEAAEVLGDRLGPILFQLPPNMGLNLGRLRAFLETLPSGHRYAFEFRNDSWYNDSVFDLLTRQDAALVIADMGGRTTPVRATASFVYLRLHGPGQTAYTGSYDAAALAGWRDRIAAWRDDGRDVYCFFDNDESGHAAMNAQALQTMLTG